jgi:hypothetical protein
MSCCISSAGGICCGMTNAFRIVLDSASVRRAAVEDVSETVIAAIYLLHERSVDEIVAKLRPGELEQVIKLVGRCPSCYPPAANIPPTSVHRAMRALARADAKKEVAVAEIVNELLARGLAPSRRRRP